MAGIYDPYTPGDDDTGAVQPDPGIMNHINSFMANPQAQAALLTAGLSLMQPPSFGDNAASQIGRAIGAAGSSQRLLQEQADTERKLDISQQQADAKSEVAAARADAAGSRSNAAADRLQFQRANLEEVSRRNRLNNAVRLSGMYQNYAKDVAARNAKAKANADLLGTPFTPETVQPFNSWVQTNPMLRTMGLIGDETAPSAEPPGSVPDSGQSYEQAPRNPADRIDGQVYSTPSGNLKWNQGRGWSVP